MEDNALGTVYADGSEIIRQGESGEAMYVILEGSVEVVIPRDGSYRRLAVLGEGEFFGEMEIFDAQARSATVRALGRTRVLTVDKKLLLRRMQEDPTLALRFLEILSQRMRSNNETWQGGFPV